jgi:hypothetical protein
MRCGVEQGKETRGVRRPDTRGRAVSERKEREEKRAVGGDGPEEGMGRRKRTEPSEWLGQGGLKRRRR